MDKALEDRLREAIKDKNTITVSSGKIVLVHLADAKRLLYRLKKENSTDHKLEYRSKK